MGFGPVVPARIDFSDPLAPSAPDFGDIYHARAGALGQARHVFLGGNGLPGRWAGRERFVVLEVGFGLGNNFLATRAAWRDDPQRCDRLWYVAVDKHPPTRGDLARAHAQSELKPLADDLVSHWPPLTPDLHGIDFDAGRVRLLLAFGDAGVVLRELVARIDAIYLDGFARARNPDMWQDRIWGSLKRLALPGATLSTWSVAHAVRAGLAKVGFEVSTAPGFGGKREMTVARFAPRFVVEPPPGRRPSAARRVAVIGAGLAGAAAARALTAQGIACTVFDRHPSAAMGTSANPGGLFHGIVSGDDNLHARWFRAAALTCARQLKRLFAAGWVSGHCEGLLRLENALTLDAMRQRLSVQGVPDDWLRAVDGETADRLTGLGQAAFVDPRASTGLPAWWFRDGGWADPAAVVRAGLAASGAETRFGVAVDHLRTLESGWQLLAADGRLIAQVDAVVLANTDDAARLIGPIATWPLTRVRGQITVLACAPDLPSPRLPIADAGYLLRLADGRLVCGATSQAGDDDAACRDDDHLQNLARLQRLTGMDQAPTLERVIGGRVGWRLTTPDRLPLVGPVVDLNGEPGRVRQDQPRFQPRIDGLYVLTALGSRGITQAALAGELLAASLTGAPMPVPASLVDAVDNARFAARAQRAGPAPAAPSIEDD